MEINLKLHPVPGLRCGQSRLSLSTFVYSLSWMQYFIHNYFLEFQHQNYNLSPLTCECGPRAGGLTIPMTFQNCTIRC
jgi:hypothetical protein